VDAAIAKTQSELGNLDINRRELALKQDAATRDLAFGDYLKRSLPTDGTAGTTGAGVGGGGGSGPPDPNSPAGQVAHRTAAFWSAQGYTPEQVAGIMAGGPGAESGFNPGAAGDGGTSVGLYQHHAERMAELKKRYGPNPTEAQQHEFAAWEISPQGTHAHVGAALKNAKTPEEAAAIWTREFERPKDTAGEIARRSSVAGRYLGYGIPTQAAAPVVAAPVANPNAGPREARLLGNAPITTGQYAPTITSPVAPATAPTDPAVATTPTAPMTTGQADDPNTAAVKQASAALLNMPEADAAAAYPAVVRELQARGFAMQAPPTYPGHAALQAIVGGGDPTAPAVEPSRQAMRLGGTAAAGPAAGPETLPRIEQPHRLYQTGLAGVTINGPGNTLAPPIQTAAAPPVAQAQAQAPTTTTPPPAPSRVIQREPLIQSGIFAGLTRTQASTIANTPGVKPATIMEQIATARHQNDVIRQGDATQAAIDEKENYARRHQSQQDQIAAQKAADDRADKDKAAKLAEATSAREAAKAHDEILNRIGAKKAAGIPTTPDEDRLYAGSYYAKQQDGATATTMDGPDGQKIPVLITRRLPKQYPEPEGGALPLVVKSPDAPTTAKSDASQSAAAGYADRMQIAVQAMEKLDDTSTYFQRGLEKAGSYTGYSVNSSEYEQLRTAQKAFLGAILKRESGAEVKDSEFERDKGLYFPQPGESVETANLKKRFRQAAMEATIRAAGEGYKPASSVAAPQIAPKVIKFDATGKRVSE
jgi:hypothetical protein